jgi:carbon-monoxide dehydrogenase large subunit
MGQGIVTTYLQLAVDVFGVPFERIRVIQGDTDLAQGFGSAGSRSMFTGGSAIHVASEKTVAHAKGLAAEALEAPAADIEYKAGHFRVAGTYLSIDLFELAGRQPQARIFIDSHDCRRATWPTAATCAKWK